MSPRIHRGRTAARFCLGLAALSCVFVGIAAANAQAPVITNPGDLRTLSVNTAFARRSRPCVERNGADAHCARGFRDGCG